MKEEVQRTLLEIADDELILGWRDSEWTGIAPFLEEDVAFSSIAQNEIGHARALYEIAAARRILYEAADAVRLEWLEGCGDDQVMALAAKIELEERYHRMHADMWAERLAEAPEYREALAELWPHALGVLPAELRPRLAERFPELPASEPAERGEHAGEWPALWEEMTMVRRVAPGATW